MKLKLILFSMILISALPSEESEAELVCVKTNKASNTCYYNFKIGGINYSYVDNGCKEKKENVLKKANQGKLALVKEWKIPCTVPKEKPSNQF